MKNFHRVHGFNRLILVLLALFLAAGLSAQTREKKSPSDVLVPGGRTSGTIILEPESPIYKTFKISVPHEAFAIRLSLENSPADLDIYIKYDEDIMSYDDVDSYSALTDYNESLFYSRMAAPPLKTGIYYVDVVYHRRNFPEANGRILREIPFDLNYTIITTPEEQPLRPGAVRTSTIVPDEAMVKIFSVTVPEGAEALRVDLFDTTGDLDLLVRYGQPALNKNDADYKREWLLSRESLVIRREPGENSLQPGVYYITVYDQVINDAPETFSIISSLREAPPDFLQVIPFLTSPEDQMERALLSTIELITEFGAGSGCLVSRDGLVLSNWHVIQSDAGGPSKTIYGAVTLSPYNPPEELFQLEVVGYDEERDLALLRIVRGFYGQPLPYGYSFPYFEIGNSARLRIGQPLVVIGYPSIGGTGSRTSVSITQGIVSGYEQTHYGTIIKTDAGINDGNSGGAAINAFYELIGLPTMVVNVESGQMGFIHPVTLLPEEWLEMIDAANRK